jgi:hypothetical protein
MSATYYPGHVKRNADTHEVALRTGFPEADYPDMAWLIATLNMGARTAPTTAVEGWDDLYTPVS